ncbi:hypothetical protein [Chitinophaga sp. S165]|uniref:hypothetical protein n=1 Tax=Chitinophaga sp. S165 TaxID=2135462 RepID=UPI000D841C49|nr:hypothetical protein [Chitinophaga sp. S165]PWV56458.1 hypothetical protein C7475_101974 [Chitinophaga sp. S165]
MSEYRRTKQRFIPYLFWMNVVVLILILIYVAVRHKWPEALYIVAFNTILLSTLMNKAKLASFEILEKESVVKIKMERWFSIGGALEYPVADMQVIFERDEKGSKLARKDVFMIFVNNEKIIEVPPNDKGWEAGTLRQIVGEFEEYKSREKHDV